MKKYQNWSFGEMTAGSINDCRLLPAHPGWPPSGPELVFNRAHTGPVLTTLTTTNKLAFLFGY